MANKAFSFDTVAALCSAILAKNVAIGKDIYEMMSALDGERTANAFQHQFRSVLQRAKELKEQADKGQKLQPAAPKARATAKSKTPMSANGSVRRSECPHRFDRTVLMWNRAQCQGRGDWRR